ESANPKFAFPVLLDSQYKLWGKLGIIARPTVLIIGKDDKALWIRAGHAYDFAPALRSNLSHALGIVGTGAPKETVEARALTNNTVGSRVKRQRSSCRPRMWEGDVLFSCCPSVHLRAVSVIRMSSCVQR
ncbi:MAG: hypothetical protein U9Q07_11975, partial [Planctomycetota bacterium]|nr:hypothetical protein [Planctomycetota bacterium]